MKALSQLTDFDSIFAENSKGAVERKAPWKILAWKPFECDWEVLHITYASHGFSQLSTRSEAESHRSLRHRTIR